MIWKRQLAIFGLAFVLVLGGGMALAAVGSLGGSDEGAAPADETYEEPADEPTPADQPPPPEPQRSPDPVKNPVTSVRPPATPSKASSADAVMAKRMYVDAGSMVESGLGPPSIPRWVPVWLARIGAFIELIGAGLLVIGIFSRVWAFGMVVLVGISFYATCGSIVGDYGLTPLPAMDFNSVFSHVGLLVLAAWRRAA